MKISMNHLKDYDKNFWKKCLDFSKLHTPWGDCTLHGGYWVLGHNIPYKSLHRALFAECVSEIPEGYVVHHKDHNKWNNTLSNLEVMSLSEHSSLHNSGINNPMYDVHLTKEKNPFYGKKHSVESRRKISEANKGKHDGSKNPAYNKKGVLSHWYGKNHKQTTLIKMSKSRNSTGYFRVSQRKNKKYPKGFFRYCYTENRKQKEITAITIEKLKQKVLKKGLIWRELNGNN